MTRLERLRATCERVGLTKMTRLEQLQAACEKVGLYVTTYSPGDGVN
jgi:hypothetical protein